MTPQEKHSQMRELARRLVRNSMVEDALAQFVALTLEHVHDDRIKPLKARIEELEAKLAKAVEALRFLEIAATGAGVPHPKERELLHDCIHKARIILAELKGQDNAL